MAKTKRTKSSRSRGGSGRKAAPRKAGSTPAPSTNDYRPRARPTSVATTAKLDKMRERLEKQLGQDVTLTVRAPAPGSGRTPWSHVAKLSGFNADYDQLAKALGQIDTAAGRELGRRKLARIKVTYRGVKKKGRRERTSRDWTIGEIAPLEVALSRSQTALRDAFDEYGDESISPSSATEIEIWISDETANDTGEF